MRSIPAIIMLLVTLSTLSCTKERVVGGKGSLLRITPGTEIHLKSIVSNSNISEKELGVQITNYTGTSLYEGLGSLENLKLLRPIPGGPWELRDQNNLPAEIKVYDHSAKIYAYYPYTPELVQGIGSLATMEIDIPASQEYGQVYDYLWGFQDKTLPKGGFSISAKYPNVYLRLNHSLSMVAFVFYKSGYTGEGRVASMEMRSKTANNIFRVNKSEANDLKMSLSNGGITGGSMVSALNMTDINALIELEAEPEKTPTSLFSNKNFYMLLAPVNNLQREDIEFRFIIDGETYTTSLSGAEALDLTPGNATIFTVKLSPNSLKVTGVAEWNLVSYEVSSGYDDLWYGLQPVRIGDLYWAPVNAGYLPSRPYGLLYQWHRKYGQTYDEAPLPNQISLFARITMDQANDVINANNFYKYNESPYDFAITQESSWSSDQRYNPCPLGWRLPTDSEYSSLISLGYSIDIGYNNLQGIWVGESHSGDRTNCLFFPFAGRRRGSGNAEARGSSAYYWSSTVSASNARTFYCLSASSTVGVSMANRVEGMSVRCVKPI